jgi:hypothetical protein
VENWMKLETFLDFSIELANCGTSDGAVNSASLLGRDVNIV